MLNIDFKLFTLVAALLGHSSYVQAESSRWNLGLEMGNVRQSYNDVQIPGNTGTRFSLTDVAGNVPLPFYRLELFYELSNKSQLRFLIAPLSYSKSGVLGKSVNFDGQTFAASVSTKATYTFNSYRASYRYLFYNEQNWRWHVGGTLKIRDAEIALQQGTVSASNTNLGIVPLLNLYGEYKFANKWQFIVDFDGLVAPQGRALDLGLKLNYDLEKNWYLGGGLRVLEGGADNDKVYSFAQFNYIFVSSGYLF